MDGLYELLQRGVRVTDTGRDGFFDLADGRYRSPGFWTAYAARARARNLRLADLAIPEGTLGYARAIAIERALGGADTYPYDRRRVGETYSPLVLLESQEQTDAAVGAINGCVRGLFSEPEYAEFVSAICELVGDLLDNVWSHGKSTGFSMAQRWRGNPEGFMFEFAVADCGLGFLRELKRVGIAGVDTHQAAIDWCIQNGNSTKKKSIDNWAQRLPPDVMGNPMPGLGQVVESDNHHMGLGLSKLMECVERFNGRLWLVSGDAMLIMHPGWQRRYEITRTPWQGVALACRFDSAQVLAAARAGPADEFEDMLEALLGARP